MVKLVKKTESIQQEKKELITESGVNRIEHWINEHDCATITASREYIYNTVVKDGQHVELPEVLEFEIKIPDNLEDKDIYSYLKSNYTPLSRSLINLWNSNLKDTLRGLGYGVTKINGVYTAENKPTVFEKSFFVVNLNDDPEFIKNICKLGAYYNQDCVLIKPKGDDAFLYGTNNSSWLGFEETKDAGYFQKRVFNDNMSEIRNHFFAFNPSELPGEKPIKQLRKNKDISESYYDVKTQALSKSIERNAVARFKQHCHNVESGKPTEMSSAWKYKMQILKENGDYGCHIIPKFSTDPSFSE